MCRPKQDADGTGSTIFDRLKQPVAVRKKWHVLEKFGFHVQQRSNGNEPRNVYIITDVSQPQFNPIIYIIDRIDMIDTIDLNHTKLNAIGRSAHPSKNSIQHWWYNLFFRAEGRLVTLSRTASA